MDVQALKNTTPAAMAGQASEIAVAPPMGAVPAPDLIACILCDHSNTLTTFSHFFQAAAKGESDMMNMLVGGLCIDIRLHSQAEMAVLYPLLNERGGPVGAAWASRCMSEHSMVEQSVAECLALRGTDSLTNRVKQMQSEWLAHQGEEESQVLPYIVSLTTPDERLALASSFKAVKQAAPLTPQIVDVAAAAASSALGQTIAAAPVTPAAGAGPSPGAPPGRAAGAVGTTSAPATTSDAMGGTPSPGRAGQTPSSQGEGTASPGDEGRQAGKGSLGSESEDLRAEA